MRFLVVGVNVPAAELIPLATAADDRSFDGFVLGDHIVMPEEANSLAPYAKDGRSPMDVERQWPDPWVAIGAMAAATTRLHFVTSIYVLPLRHPLLAAKSVYTAAVLSGGRVILGVGVGWLSEEYEALGADFATRGKRLDEQISILRSLSANGIAEHHGTFYDFPRLSVLPAPSTRVPIYIGGESPQALRRAALLGDGYLSGVRRAKSLVELRRRIIEQADATGKVLTAFNFVGTCADAVTPDDYAALEEAGIGSVCVLPWAPLHTKTPPVSLEQKIRSLDEFRASVIDKMAP